VTIWNEQKLLDLLVNEPEHVRDEVLDALQELEANPDDPPPALKAKRLRGAAARRSPRSPMYLGEFPHGYRVTYSVVHGAPPVLMDETIVKVQAVMKVIEQPPIAQDRGPIYP